MDLLSQRPGPLLDGGGGSICWEPPSPRSTEREEMPGWNRKWKELEALSKSRMLEKMEQTNNLRSQGFSSRVWSSPAWKSRHNKLGSSEQPQGDLTVCHGNISLRPASLSPTKCNPVSQGRMPDFHPYIKTKWPECTGGQGPESKNCWSLRLLFSPSVGYRSL